MNPQPRFWIPAALLTIAVVFASPHRIVDADALSHLATGRWIMDHGVPHTDPFTVAHAARRWSNPEWLGDVVWFGLYRVGGEAATQIFKLLIIAVGLLLAFRRGVSMGAAPWILLALMLLLLPASAGRFTVRNHIHALWLIPLYQMVARQAHRQRVWWIVLLPLGWLWANLHSSFVVGWAILIASALDQRADGERPDHNGTAVVLGAHLLLPMLGPLGMSAYSQLWDHLVGAGVYRHFIAEWQSPLTSPAILAMIPLHLAAVTGVLGLVRQENRRSAGSAVLLLVGLAMAYSSRRFIPLVLVLSAPPMALFLTRTCARIGVRLRRGVVAASAILATGYLVVAVVIGRSAQQPLFERDNTARRATLFLAQHAAHSSCVFNSFNAGPWLLWNAPAIKHFIDPRNNHAAQFLKEYVRLLGDPARLARRMDRLSIDLALLSLGDRRTNGIVDELEQSPRWRLVFLDGRHALYARVDGPSAGLARRFGYRVIGARRAVDVELLEARDVAARAAFARDLAQLRQQGALLARGHEACLAALTTASSTPEKIVAPLDVVRGVVTRLSPSATLVACLGAGLRRAGLEQMARGMLREARMMFPDDPVIRRLNERGSPARVRSGAGKM